MAWSASTVQRRLPTELTRFIGRERELSELAERVAGSRLVTLTGAAGSGKTRLALELVSAPGGHHPTLDGRAVWWVELAGLRDAALVVAAVAEAAGVREEVRGGAAEALARLLAPTRALLVLDNCEHLVDACAELADLLLRQCPDLSILATSREALGVPGERAWLVPPLSLPAGDSSEALSASEAVRLFVDRAEDLVPGFALTPGNAGAVAEICRRLDGIPLAIELAAARVRVLGPADIRDRLDDVFRLLTAGGRTAVPRHRTLRAALDWSHDLLPDDGRALLRRLAVFRGGFDLDGAERVGAAAGVEETDVLDVLARLVDRSMIAMREHAGAARYFMLEPIRQYATEKLIASGEERDTRRRHAALVLEQVERAEPHLTRADRKLWVDRLAPDLDNIRSALTWTRDHDAPTHVRLVARLWWFWFSTQHWAEAGRWIEGALELARRNDADPAGDAAGDPADRAALLFAAGALAALRARSDLARPLLEEAVSLAGSLGDPRLEAYALNYLGMTYAGEGRTEALDYCGRAAARFREDDDLYGLRLALLLQGSALLGLGRLEEAERFNREGVDVARRFGLPRDLAVALQNLAVVHLHQGRLDEAEVLVREAMAASRLDPSHYFVATGLAYLAEIEGRKGRPLAAARWLGAAEGIRDRIGASPFPLDKDRMERHLPAFLAEAGPEAFERVRAGSRTLRPEPLLEEIVSSGGAHGAADPAIPDTSGRTAPPSATTTGTPYAPAPATTPATPSTPARAPSPGVELDVRALGPFLVEVNGEAVPAGRWTYAKPRELLAFLLLHPQGAPRDTVGEALWPGAARGRVKNSFHVTLHHLRKALGHPEWVVTEGERYRLEPKLRYRLDATTFDDAARNLLERLRATESGNGPPSHTGDGGDGPGHIPPGAAELRAVLELYRGDLMDGEVLGRWIDPHRDRLRRRFVDLSLALGLALEAEDPAAAAELYQALAAREELDEEVHRRLMRTWARAGDRARALRHYDHLVAVLREALDADPEPATVDLYRELRAGSTSRPEPAGSRGRPLPRT